MLLNHSATFPSLIQESSQCRARTSVTYQPFPRRIAVQFRQKFWEVTDQFLAFSDREISDGCLDFLYCAHKGKLSSSRRIGKPALNSNEGGRETQAA